jgi:CheY-like chemotaxis protein
MAAGRPRILVVEDELVLRFDVADTLRDAGYAVIEAPRGEDGLQYLKSGIVFDLICSDIRMPGIDGHELSWLERLKR